MRKAHFITNCKIVEAEFLGDLEMCQRKTSQAMSAWRGAPEGQDLSSPWAITWVPYLPHEVGLSTGIILMYVKYIYVATFLGGQM